MRPKSVLLLALTMVPIAWGQTGKFSGTLKCGKADPQYAIPVGDRPDHMFVMIQAKCTWQGAEIAGLPARDLLITGVADISGGGAQTHGNSVGTVSNGDKFFIAQQGAASSKQDNSRTEEGTWSYTGGTGKLQGIKGQGTYKGKVGADDFGTWQVEGSYQLAAH